MPLKSQRPSKRPLDLYFPLFAVARGRPGQSPHPSARRFKAPQEAGPPGPANVAGVKARCEVCPVDVPAEAVPGDLVEAGPATVVKKT